MKDRDISLGGGNVEAKGFSLTPKDVGIWLASLPILNNEKAIRKLSDSLVELNCTDMDDSTRFEILQLYQRHLDTVAHEVQKRRVGLSLPLSSESLKLAESITNLFNQVALGYKIIVLNVARQGSASQELSSNKIIWACYWALVYLTEVLRSAYESYRPFPKGVWKEAHQLYSYAFGEGLVHYKLVLEQSETLPRDSIRGVYKRLLLMGLSNPYQLPFRAVRSVYELLERLAHKVALTPSSQAKKRPCMFVVDFDIDQPGIPYLSHSSIVDSQAFLLDTTELVVSLRDELERHINGEPIELDGDASIYDSERVDMLRSLIVQWGIRPIRTSERVQTNHQVNMVVGLISINYVLSGFNEEHSSEVDSLREDTRQMLKGTFGYQQFKQKHKVSIIPNWEVVDESLAGLQLSHMNAAQANIRVGELIALNDGQNERWTLGVVRWAKGGQGNDLCLGIFKLGIQGYAGDIQQFDGVGGPYDGAFESAVVLPETKTLGHHHMVVVPKGHYKPDGSLWLRRNHQDQIIQPTNLVASSRVVDCFEFKVKSPS